ncbi:MAG: Nramp family divalent metal transporter [candidate division Zixibacteria bacterium]|nr:Nramp family divalent metal transporter [candidate division Zixibacteria bacterium]
MKILSRWRQVFVILAILGPGFITSNVDNDAGGITTYSIAGAHFGYRFLWSFVPITFLLILIQEMSARMGVVTGKGLSDLIREQFGVKITFYFLIILVAANYANTVAEFAGVAASLEIFRVGREWSVPVAGVLVWLLAVKGSYKSVEKIFLVATLFYAAYIVTGFMARPDWSEVARGFAVPQMSFNPGEIGILIALVGTTIAPWMQFYLQSAIVEKDVKIEHLKFSRLDVLAGSIVVSVVAAFIVIACAATLHPQNIRIESAEEAALALRPLAGDYAAFLFSFGLLNASLFAASILPLSTAYVVCEGMGWENGVNKTFAEAPQFYGLYSLLILLGVLTVVVPGLPLIQVMYWSQVLNGILLPLTLAFMVIIINKPKVMGNYVNKKFVNYVTIATVAILTFLSLSLVISAF